MSKNETTETLEEVRARVAIANRFSWWAVSGISSIVFREKGEAALNAIWRTLLAAEQKDRFRAALVKLGIDKDPPAVAAAKYHYFSNSIGGLRMQIMIESPRKAWIRYLSPWGSYPGMAALTVPASVRRTILSTWHPRNGELLNCPRLGWIATKFIAEGHPYDEGYFCEFDRDLDASERFSVRHVESSPEFDPETAPRLDPAMWPEIRVVKGGYNYGVDYLLHTAQIVQDQFGNQMASQFCTMAMRFLAVQFVSDLARALAIAGRDALSLAELAAGVLRSYKNDVSVVTDDAGRAEMIASDLHPFNRCQGPILSDALFSFFEMAARVLNGRVSVRRMSDGPVHRWIFTDEGKWLW